MATDEVIKKFMEKSSLFIAIGEGAFTNLRGESNEGERWKQAYIRAKRDLDEVNLDAQEMEYFPNGILSELTANLTDLTLHFNWRINTGKDEALREANSRYRNELMNVFGEFIKRIMAIIPYLTLKKTIQTGSDFGKTRSDISNAEINIIKLRETVDELRKKMFDEIQSAKNAALSQLQLKKAIGYWGDMTASNKENFKKMAWVNGGYFGLSVALFLSLDWFTGFSFRPDMHFYEMGFFGLFKISVILFIWLWLARILVKSFFAFFIGWLDSRERVVMIDTYLSLQLEGGGLPDEGKSQLLQAIFRPGNNGLVKNDPMPPVPLGLVMKSFQEKGN